MYLKSEAVPQRPVSASTAAGARSEDATVNRRLREYLQLLEAECPDLEVVVAESYTHATEDTAAFTYDCAWGDSLLMAGITDLAGLVVRLPKATLVHTDPGGNLLDRF